jgi:group I intron endonuclease
MFIGGMSMEIHIYAIVNDKNGKIYVGQTKRGYLKRFAEHLSKNETCPLMKKAVEKYGADAFHVELFDIAYDRTTANEKEKMWIRLLQTSNAENGYNLSLGGEIGHFNEAVIERMKAERIGAGNSFYGKHHTSEARKRMSDKKKGIYELEKHPRARKVLCVEKNIVYECIKKAGQDTGISPTHISQACRNQYGRKTAGGYHWSYV